MHKATGKAWPLSLLLLLAVLGPPILGIGLVGGLPRTPSANGSITALKMFPFAAIAFIALAATRAEPGAKRVTFVIAASASTGLWGLVLVIGMLAP